MLQIMENVQMLGGFEMKGSGQASSKHVAFRRTGSGLKGWNDFLGENITAHVKDQHGAFEDS